MLLDHIELTAGARAQLDALIDARVAQALSGATQRPDLLEAASKTLPEQTADTEAKKKAGK